MRTMKPTNVVSLVAGVLLMLMSAVVLSRDSPPFKHHAEYEIEKVVFRERQRIVRFESKDKAKPLKFSWNDCGSSSSVVRVTAVTLQPDPLVLPGSPQIAFSATVSKNLSSVISMHLEIYRQVAFLWIPIPCVDNIGSCTYINVCPQFANSVCPPSFAKYGIPCHCPIAKGNYKLPLSPVKVDIDVPRGHYRVTANLKDGGVPIGCLYVDVSINDSFKRGFITGVKSNKLDTRGANSGSMHWGKSRS